MKHINYTKMFALRLKEDQLDKIRIEASRLEISKSELLRLLINTISL